MTERQVIWDTFLVRIWRESPGRVWRGQITHLPSQTSAPFATLRQAEMFIRRFVPVLEELPPSAQESQ